MKLKLTSVKFLLVAVAVLALLVLSRVPSQVIAANSQAGKSAQAAAPGGQGVEARMAKLEAEVRAAKDRAEIENLFSQYMFLHSAFRDDLIIPLWVKKGTPGIRAQYSNAGVYNTWDSVIAYHQDRPHPVGKLVVHYAMNPMIEVAGDGKTA